MAYFPKYYMEFADTYNRLVRVDILDSEGIVPASPYQLIGTGTPLTTEVINSGEEKEVWLLGKQITISYVYDADPNTPLPEVFLEATERRFRVEVRKAGVLSGVYFIRPDGCERPFLHDPVEVSVTAVDGLAYAEGTPFNMYNDDQSLKYEKIPLYEAILTRALHLVVDPALPINVLNSLLPTNVDPGARLLFDTYVHTDAFYDFVKGASTVKEVLEMFCISFNSRLFLEDGAIWWQRIEDMNATAYPVVQYLDEDTANDTTPYLPRSLGPGTTFDAIPINADAIIRTTPALKRIDAEVEYDAINVIQNFDWSAWDGSFFANWSDLSGVDISRDGAGTIEDPYRAFIEYNTTLNPALTQVIGTAIPFGPFSIGDIVDFELAYEFNNTKSFGIAIYGVSAARINYMNGSGEWTGLDGDTDRDISFSLGRSGKKRIGSTRIKSKPMPSNIGGPFYIIVALFSPSEMSDVPDNADPAGVFISPIKMGVIGLASLGRHITAINSAAFSRTIDGVEFKFIDTGEDGVSNTLFTNTEPVASWTTGKPGVDTQDIERFMAESYINQAQRSVTNWEGSVKARDIGLKNVYNFQAIPGKKFIAISDRLNDRTCEHALLLQEVFVEGTATVTYSEYDIEDEEN